MDNLVRGILMCFGAFIMGFMIWNILTSSNLGGTTSDLPMYAIVGAVFVNAGLGAALIFWVLRFFSHGNESNLNTHKGDEDVR